MAQCDPERDGRYWVLATWSVPAWFVLTTVVALIVYRISGTDSTEVPVRAILVATGFSAAAAFLLRWTATATVRPIASAAVVVSVMWGCASVLTVWLDLATK